MGNSPAGKPSYRNLLKSYGLRVFPLPRDSKVPRTPGFLDHATIDPDFDMDRNNAGVATGRDVVVFDFDVKPEKGIDARPVLESWLAVLDEPPLLVATPSGGRHAYFALAPGETVANSAGRIAPGVDVRGLGGYVVAPGSTIDGVPYEVLHAPFRLPPVPDFLKRHLIRSVPKSDLPPLADLDDPAAIRRAREFLSTDAAPAIEGAHGDDTTFRVACRIKDFGVSEGTALDLMLEIYNERCSPPWPYETLRDKVANAYAYGKLPPAAASPQADFAEALTAAQIAAIEATAARFRTPPAHEDQPATAPIASLDEILHPLAPFDATILRKRDWLLGHYLIRGYISALISPPGVGKTSLGIAQALALASGKPILGPFYAPSGAHHVLYWTQEDPIEEMRLRLVAAMRHHGLTWDDLTDETGTCRLHMFSGVERPLRMAVKGSDGATIVAAKDAGAILDYVQKWVISAAIFDPFIEFHPANENDNQDQSRVTQVFRVIASKGHCAVGIVHHTRKHPKADASELAGDMYAGRGASAVVGMARVVHTAFTMDEDMYAEIRRSDGGAMPARHDLIRVDAAKNNLARLSPMPAVFRRRSVEVEEVGESVAVMDFVATEARETVEMSGAEERARFIEDVRFVLDHALQGAVRSVSTVQVAEFLLADEYEDGAIEPGRYGMVGLDTLRKRVTRLFTEEGMPVAEELDGFEVRKKGRDMFVLRHVVADTK